MVVDFNKYKKTTPGALFCKYCKASSWGIYTLEDEDGFGEITHICCKTCTQTSGDDTLELISYVKNGFIEMGE